MKKLMTILVVFAMCGVAMAQGVDLQKSGQYKYEKGKYTLITKSSDLYKTPLTMNYERAGSHVGGNAYFTTMSESALTAYNNKNNTDYNKVVVQFLGTEIDDSRHYMGNVNENITGTITDYGIYLYENNYTLNDIKNNLMSVSNGNYFALDAGTKFGIYYTDSTGREWYSTENYVGTWDSDQHYINYYDEDGNKIDKNGRIINDHGGVVNPEDGKRYSEKVDIRYTCAFMTTTFGDHWEFMLETKLDKPYYNVDPKDFEGNGDVEIPSTSGQPLPGTLATLLIGGLCAGSLRKRNKK